MSQERWDLVITPKRGWLDIDLAGVWRYRDLVAMLFQRDLIAIYKQTLLGPLWFILQPLLTATAFYVVFAKIARMPTGAVPPFLFYFCSVLVWSYFSGCIAKTAETFTANAQVFGKVYFPRLVVPIAACLGSLVPLAIQLALLLVLVAWHAASGSTVSLGISALLVVPLVAYVAVLAMAVGGIISALTVRYRDLAVALTVFVQFWMYATPVVYPLSEIPSQWQWIFRFNPMAAPVESFRGLLLGTSLPPVGLWASSVALTLGLACIGLLLFARAEKDSMDTV